MRIYPNQPNPTKPRHPVAGAKPAAPVVPERTLRQRVDDLEIAVKALAAAPAAAPAAAK